MYVPDEENYIIDKKGDYLEENSKFDDFDSSGSDSSSKPRKSKKPNILVLKILVIIGAIIIGFIVYFISSLIF